MDLTAYPGGDLVEEGLADLARGEETIPALLVAIGAPRLRRLGLDVPDLGIAIPEHRPTNGWRSPTRTRRTRATTPSSNGS